MIRVIATFDLKPEAKEQAMPLFEELISLTRKEEGCAGYDLIKSASGNNQLVLLEGWENQAVLDTHSASEHFTRIVPQLVAMCITAPSIEAFEQII